MKSFKQYLGESKEKEPSGHDQKKKKPLELPTLMTHFGSHAKEQLPLPTLKTVFGTLSKIETNRDLDESSKSPKTAKEQIGDDNDHIHKTDSLRKSGVVAGYSETSYLLNNFLHEAHRGAETKNNQFHRKIVNDLDKELDRARLSKDTHVYTGLPQGPHELFKAHGVEPGKNIKVHLPAYTSTSTRYISAKRFAANKSSRSSKFGKYIPVNHEVHKPLNKLDDPNKDNGKHILKIHLPKGTKAGSIKSQSRHDHENEVLLHRGHELEIHHRPTVEPDGTHIWHARVIKHNPEQI